METINDLYNAFRDCVGDVPSGQTIHSRDAVRDEFHRRGYANYREDGNRFLDEIFADGWAWLEPEEVSA